MISKCIECSSDFNKIRNNHNCCSRKCSNKNHKRRLNRGLNLEDRECVWCGNKYSPLMRKSKYCSRNCSATACSFRYPEKRKARKLLGYAIIDGSIIKPNICSVCSGSGRIEGHHEDYSRPFEVKWVCHKCHRDIHNENKKVRETCSVG